jgi:hypothetical protein
MRYVFGIYDDGQGNEDKRVNGQEAVFRAGMYITDDPLKIKLLDAEIVAKHPNIKSNPSQFVTEDFADPIKQIENKARIDLLRELQEKGLINLDLGNHETFTKFKASIQSSADLPAEITGTAAVRAALANLSNRKPVHIPPK